MTNISHFWISSLVEDGVHGAIAEGPIGRVHGGQFLANELGPLKSVFQLEVGDGVEEDLLEFLREEHPVAVGTRHAKTDWTCSGRGGMVNMLHNPLQPGKKLSH